MKLSTLLIGPPAVGLALVVAIANRRTTVFSIDPFSSEAPLIAFEVPLYLLLFVALLIGVLIGGSSAWIGQTGWRKKARKSSREVKHLEKDLERSRAETADPEKTGQPVEGQKRLG